MKNTTIHPTPQLTIVWKQKTPVLGVLCGSSKREENPISLFSPQFCSSYARLNSWCTRKPLLLLTAPSAHLWANPPHDGGWRTYCTTLSSAKTNEHQLSLLRYNLMLS